MLFFKKKYTEAELISGCVANDRRCQEALYRQFFPEMMRMCLRSTQDEDTALHILNNGFLRVFQKINTFEGRGSLEGWVRRLVWNSLVDFYRKEKQYRQFIVLDEPNAVQYNTYHAKPENTLEEEDLMEMVSELPENTKQVFLKYVVEGYGHAEIAEHLGITEGTSKWHLNAARKRLQARLNDIDNFETKKNTI